MPPHYYCLRNVKPARMTTRVLDKTRGYHSSDNIGRIDSRTNSEAITRADNDGSWVGITAEGN